MKRILVLTDFSKCANNATRYAIKLAEAYGFSLVFYHSTYQYFLSDMPNDFTNKLIENNKSDLKELLIENVKKIYTSLKIQPKKVKYLVKYGTHLVERIEEVIKMENIDLIIMGTKGASGMDRVLFGSNTVKVIDHASCPVLSISQAKRFKPFKKIMIFSELNDLENELKDIIPFAKKFNCLLDICHLTKNPKTINPDVFTIISQQKELSGYKNITMTTVQRAFDKDLVTQIEMIVSNTRPDMICLHTMKYNWFERLFTFSYTKDLVYHSKSSILTFSKRSVLKHIPVKL
jgi:nucleotide-binding universal stress UspA family protein